MSAAVTSASQPAVCLDACLLACEVTTKRTVCNGQRRGGTNQEIKHSSSPDPRNRKQFNTV